MTAAAIAFLYWRLKISCPRSVTTRIAHSPECYSNALDMFFFQRTFWQRYEPSGELVESPPLSKYENVKQDLEGCTSEEKFAILGKVQCIATVELDMSYV